MTPTQIREHFPALARRVNGQQAVYFDGPGGSQVPLRVSEAMSNHLLHHNANLSPHFASGRETIAMTARVRETAGRFLNCSADEVSFGQNMTSLTFAFSRALALTWQRGDNVVVSEMDHDANITPWVLAAADRGVEVRSLRYHSGKASIDPADLDALLDERTRLVAVTCSSNIIGSHVDIPWVCAMAHAVGAKVFVDAVHHAPHDRIDVRELDCDFLVCSAYKFFGPHIGMLYGKLELMSALKPYKIVPAPEQAPYCWETGTQNFTAIAGLGATFDYLLSLGGEGNEDFAASYARIRELEHPLCRHFLSRLGELDGFQLHGIPSSEHRAPTFALTSGRHTPEQLARYLGDQGVFTWNGHMYAVRLIDALGLSRDRGVLRIGLMHYNTLGEVDRLIELLGDMPVSASTC